MLTKKQLDEIREHIEKAQNPIIYYDNDADGLCSFLLLRRHLGRGRGVAVRSYPELDKDYASKAEKGNADCVFVLDKPVMSKEFVERIAKLGIPLIWIDHHDIPYKFEYDNLQVYNSSRDKNGNEPVSAILFDILGSKKDGWIALAGCISDCYVPDFIDEVRKKYPEMFSREYKTAFDVLYGSEFGKVVRALNYGLKDSVSNVEKMQNFLLSCSDVGEVLEDREENKAMRQKANELTIRQKELIEDAENFVENKLLFYLYSGKTSMSSDVANELNYRNPDKYICIGYEKGAITNFSMRGKDVRAVLQRVLKQMSGVYGGGHEGAVGARVPTKDVNMFKELLKKEVN